MLHDIISTFLENQSGAYVLEVPDEETAVRAFAENVADWAFPSDPVEATGWILDIEREARRGLEEGLIVIDVEGNRPAGPAFSVSFAV